MNPEELKKLYDQIPFKPQLFYEHLSNLKFTFADQNLYLGRLEQYEQMLNDIKPILNPDPNDNEVLFNQDSKDKLISFFTKLNDLSTQEPPIDAFKDEIELGTSFVNKLQPSDTLTFKGCMEAVVLDDFKALQERQLKKEQEQKAQLQNQQYYTGITASFAKYEFNSYAVKQSLEDMCEEYASYAVFDEDLSAILAKVKAYAKIDANASKNYSKEKDSLNKIQQMMEPYLDKLQAETQHFLDEQNFLFAQAKNIQNEEQRKARIEELDKQFALGEEMLHTKRSIVQSLSNYFTNMTRGDLICPVDSLIEQVQSNTISFGGERSISEKEEQDLRETLQNPGYSCELTIQTENGPSKCTYINGVGQTVKSDGKMSAKDDPIFPHEPRPTDIQQGFMLGDCYILTGLAAVARLRPQHIRDMIKDNGDGTATVRLFQGRGNDATPVYVRVDKIKSSPVAFTRGGENCLWVSLVERAYAISGMHLSRNENNPRIANKKELDKEYESASPEQKNARESNKPEMGKKQLEAIQKASPWLVRNGKLVKWEPSIKDIEGGHESHFIETAFGPTYKEDSSLFLSAVVKQDPSKQAELEKQAIETIREHLKKGHPLTAGTASDAKVIDETHAYEIIGLGQSNDTPPHTTVRVRNPWSNLQLADFIPYHINAEIDYDSKGKMISTFKEDGIFDVKIEDFVKNFQSIGINSSEELDKIPFQAIEKSYQNYNMLQDRSYEAYRKNQGLDGIMSQDAYMEYLKYARDIHEALVDTNSWYSRKSQPYKDLLKESMEFRKTVAVSRGQKINSIQDAYNRLMEKVDSYKQSLNMDKLKDRDRRRLAVCDTISMLGEPLRNSSPLPRNKIMKNFAIQFVKSHFAKDKRTVSDARAELIAQDLIEKKIPSDAIGKVNVNSLIHPTSKIFSAVEKDIRKLGKGVNHDTGFDLDTTIRSNKKMISI